jgi:hypothetical protein
LWLQYSNKPNDIFDKIMLKFIQKTEMAKMIEYFSDFLKRRTIPNFLVYGIIIIVIWILISGFVKGLRKRRQNKNSIENSKDDNKN